MKTTASQGRFLAWLDMQGAKIKAARPRPVYYACARLAQDRARDGAVRLSAIDIERCRERALSNERARRFGRVPRDEAEWHSQVNAILADWPHRRGVRRRAGDRRRQQDPRPQSPPRAAGYLGMSAVHHDRRWPAVRLAAKRRDDWKCVRCGRRGRLEVDHIKPARHEPERAFDIDAVQTLCRACHLEKSRHEAGRETTPEQKAWRELVRQTTTPLPERKEHA